MQCVQRKSQQVASVMIMPRLVFGKVNCNCTKFPHLEDVMVSRDETETVSQYRQNLDLLSESNSEEDVSDNDEQELSLEDSDDIDAGNLELFTETMNLKGSSYYSSFQSYLAGKRFYKIDCLTNHSKVIKYASQCYISPCRKICGK